MEAASASGRGADGARGSAGRSAGLADRRVGVRPGREPPSSAVARLRFRCGRSASSAGGVAGLSTRAATPSRASPRRPARADVDPAAVPRDHALGDGEPEPHPRRRARREERIERLAAGRPRRFPPPCLRPRARRRRSRRSVASASRPPAGMASSAFRTRFTRASRSAGRFPAPEARPADRRRRRCRRAVPRRRPSSAVAPPRRRPRTSAFMSTRGPRPPRDRERPVRSGDGPRPRRARPPPRAAPSPSRSGSSCGAGEQEPALAENDREDVVRTRGRGRPPSRPGSGPSRPRPPTLVPRARPLEPCREHRVDPAVLDGGRRSWPRDTRGLDLLVREVAHLACRPGTARPAVSAARR